VIQLQPSSMITSFPPHLYRREGDPGCSSLQLQLTQVTLHSSQSWAGTTRCVNSQHGQAFFFPPAD